MKSIQRLSLLCLFLLLSLSACKRCNPENNYSYTASDAIPYDLATVLTMKIDSARTIQFRDSIYSSSFTGGPNPDCKCCDINYQQFIMTILHSDSLDIKIIESAGNGGVDGLIIDIAWVRFNASVSNGGLQPYIYTPFTSIPSLTVGNSTFTNVAKLDNNDYATYPNAAHSIWYHPTQGLLKIEFNDGRVWELA